MPRPTRHLRPLRPRPLRLRPLRRLLLAAVVLLSALVVPVLLAPPASADPCSANAGLWSPVGPAVGDAVSPWFSGPDTIGGGPRLIQFRAQGGRVWEKRDNSCNLLARKGFLSSSRYRIKECESRGIGGIPQICRITNWQGPWAPNCPNGITQDALNRWSRLGCNFLTGRNQYWNGGLPG